METLFSLFAAALEVVNRYGLQHARFIVLYCIEGVVIAAQCTGTFPDLLFFPEFRYY